MAVVGAAAKVTGPNLYGYFSSKADLLKSVHDRVNHAAWLSLDVALKGANSVNDALDRLVAGHINIARTWAPLRADLLTELGEISRVAQREYIAEWVALVRQIVPDLDVRDVKLRVLTTFKVVDDLQRYRGPQQYASLPANLASIAASILKDGARLE